MHAHQSSQVSFSVPSSLAVGKSGYQGHRKVLMALAARKRRYPGWRRVPMPLAARKRLPEAERDPGASSSGYLHSQVDQVLFLRVDQVHHVWHWRALEQRVVDLVQAVKVDQVHPTFPPNYSS